MSDEDPVERTIASYDMDAKEYTKRTLNSGDRSFCQDMMDRTLDMLPDTPRILDIGCGDGRDTAYFDNKGADVVGIDLSCEMIGIARQSYPKCTFLIMDMRDTTFLPGAFDCVWASASFIHIPSSQIPLFETEIDRILSDEGIFAFSYKLGRGEGYEYTESMRNYPRYNVYHEPQDIADLFKLFDVIEQYICSEKVFGSRFAYCWAVKDSGQKGMKGRSGPR